MLKTLPPIELARRSNYAFARDVCGRDLLQPENMEWDGLLDHQHLAVFAPRGCYKTTYFVEAYITKLILENPEIRIGLVCAKYDPHAKRRVKSVQKYLLSKEAEIYCLGIRERIDQADTWDKSEINIPVLIKGGKGIARKTKEANLTAWGYEQVMTGEHIDVLILDDVVNKEDKRSKATRDAKKAWFPEIFDFAEDHTQIIIVGTLWHPLDLYAFIANEYEDMFTFCYQSVELPSGETWMPGVYTPEKLARVKKNPIHYSHQYLNVAIGGEDTMFKREWFEFIDEPLPYNRILWGIDPAYSERDIAAAHDNGVVFLADGGTEPFVLNARIERESLTEFKTGKDNRLGFLDYSKEYPPTFITTENNGVQKAALDLVKTNPYQRDKDPKKYSDYERLIKVMVGTGSRGNADKATRAQPLADYAEIYGLKLMRTPGNRKLVDQLCSFPVVEDNDGVDALSNAWTRINVPEYGKGALTADYKHERPKLRI